MTVIQPSIRKPGAIHRPQFMASSLVYSQVYILMIFLFQHQYDTACENIKQVDILAEYIVLLHMPYFLKCPLVANKRFLE